VGRAKGGHSGQGGPFGQENQVSDHGYRTVTCLYPDVYVGRINLVLKLIAKGGNQKHELLNSL
jgi:hypothetical protein